MLVMSSFSIITNSFTNSFKQSHKSCYIFFVSSRYRFLRSLDRDLNKDNYPRLNFPEIYLLEGGYKAFFYTNNVSTNLPEFSFSDPFSYNPFNSLIYCKSTSILFMTLRYNLFLC